MLHPDKNKSIGSEGAFKLISEAWSLLYDKARRVAYDRRRSGKVMPTVPTHSGSSKPPKAANGFHNAAKTSTSSAKTPKSSNPHANGFQHLLTGQEAPNAPKGCRELDPAATPMELLQVIIDVKEEEILQNSKMINEDNVGDVEKANDGEVVENYEKVKKAEDNGSKAVEEI